MPYCARCGALLEDGMRFCTSCGFAVVPSLEDEIGDENPLSEAPSLSEKEDRAAAPSPSSRKLPLLLVVMGLACVIVALVAVVCVPLFGKSTLEVQAPVISNGVTTWDCVLFGSYPQTEAEETSTLVNADWDSNGDAVVDGVKYHRLKKSDATYETVSGTYYSWAGKDVAYFKYEPIKWRVLEIEGSKMLLVSDIALDDRKYNLSYSDITWKTCTMRSWLNGYGPSRNSYGANYLDNGFLQVAFSENEREVIEQSLLKNSDNIRYDTEGGKSTKDKVFLLAESDVWKYGRALSHGFSKASSDRDRARCCKSSDYAHAMGAWNSVSSNNSGNCMWWIRSPGYRQNYAVGVDGGGHVFRGGDNVNSKGNAVRPAIWVSLDAPSLAYAGTVASDGSATGQ